MMISMIVRFSLNLIRKQTSSYSSWRNSQSAYHSTENSSNNSSSNSKISSTAVDIATSASVKAYTVESISEAQEQLQPNGASSVDCGRRCILLPSSQSRSPLLELKKRSTSGL
jgi:hypothetical protein